MHKMKKIVQKHGRTVKHKDSAAKKARVEMKEARANEMDLEDTSSVQQLSQSEKEEAKSARKKESAHKMLYKKNNYNLTGRNGPRAVTK